MNNNDRQIQNKLLAMSEFMALDKRLSRFNVFLATDMGHREIKHTKFLCYLLDPNESHGLGDTFLRNFVLHIARLDSAFPRITDLDLSYVESIAEYKLPNISNRIDCLLKIPFRTEPQKELIIAIENKIHATQGEGQLDKYKAALMQTKGPSQIIKLIYLTYGGDDEPSDEWLHITYGNVVIPTVEAILDAALEKSSGIGSVLRDYIDLLSDDGDVDSEEDDLAGMILKDASLEKYIKSGKNNKDKRNHYGLVYLKYRRAFDYLIDFETDCRAGVLKYWQKADERREFILEDQANNSYPLILKYESSNRTYLRFSLLTRSNRENLSQLHHKKFKWLDSNCPLAFEVRFDQISDKNQFKPSVTLVLGPVENEIRTILLRDINQSLERKFDVLNFDKDSRTSVIINAKKERYIEKTTTEVPIQWLEENIIKRVNDKRHVPAGWVIDVAQKINDSLIQFFHESK